MQKSVGQLPRNLNDNEMIFVKLKKKRLSSEKDFMYRAVNPNRAFEAAEYLLGTNLYQAQRLTIDQEWLENFRNASFPEASNFLADIDWDDVDFDSEDEDANTPPIETVIQRQNTNIEGGLAPGENQIPLSVSI